MTSGDVREYADAILYDPSRYTVLQARDHANASGLLIARATVFPSSAGWLAVSDGEPKLHTQGGQERFAQVPHEPGVSLCFERRA